MSIINIITENRSLYTFSGLLKSKVLFDHVSMPLHNHVWLPGLQQSLSLLDASRNCSFCATVLERNFRNTKWPNVVKFHQRVVRYPPPNVEWTVAMGPASFQVAEEPRTTGLHVDRKDHRRVRSSYQQLETFGAELALVNRNVDERFR